MVAPDSALICEVLLFASGFLMAKSLAAKVVQVFSTAGTLLTQQAHYDWGLRAMKTILGASGECGIPQPFNPECFPLCWLEQCQAHMYLSLSLFCFCH